MKKPFLSSASGWRLHATTLPRRATPPRSPGRGPRARLQSINAPGRRGGAAAVQSDFFLNRILYKIQNFWIFGKFRRYGILTGTVKFGVKNHSHLWGQINFSSIF